MRMRLTIILLVVSSLGLLAATFPQERMKKKGPPDFKKSVEAAIIAFDSKHYGKCAKLMKQAGLALTMARRKVIREAMPQIADAKVKDNLQFENAQGQTGAAFFGVNIGNMIERTYDFGGGKTLKITIHLNEAMAKTVAGMMNMIGLGGQKGTELIKYNNNVKAILKVQPNRTEWTMAQAGAHINAVGRKVGDDEMLKHFSQAAVDRLVAAISY